VAGEALAIGSGVAIAGLGIDSRVRRSTVQASGGTGSPRAIAGLATGVVPWARADGVALTIPIIAANMANPASVTSSGDHRDDRFRL